MDQSAPVVIARAWADAEASVIKSLLGSYNIPCFYSSELPSRFYPVEAEGHGLIKLYVPASLEQEARDILEEHRRHQTSLHPIDD